MQNQSKWEISFDTKSKTALWKLKTKTEKEEPGVIKPDSYHLAYVIFMIDK